MSDAVEQPVAWLPLGTSTVAIDTTHVQRVAQLCDLDEETQGEAWDLVHGLGLRPLALSATDQLHRYAVLAVWPEGSSWLVAGTSLRLTPRAALSEHRIPDLVAPLCETSAIVGLLEHDGELAMLVDPRRLVRGDG